jgi:hypothetical protein
VKVYLARGHLAAQHARHHVAQALAGVRRAWDKPRKGAAASVRNLGVPSEDFSIFLVDITIFLVI